ncbi:MULTISPECIES: hypothetical protein [unclassified Microcoleus]|uniref:hypothetical protein n=1 Tax=unclassified Microcoleus TaxID=2642155 RepID=UPI001D2B227B|nr:MULTISPECIES: hypothetical protein [unclassified Microcoleus]MCC3600069.1 hypothetical protein [Microcoleus sp. PH2017_26_ELK_O_A]MCC3625077.1 hypothetical protein [Microcoleus sp. PH2017_36_ELK_O_B]
MKERSILSLMVGLALLGTASVSVLAQGRVPLTNQQMERRSPIIAQQQKSRLITWREFVEQGGRRFVNRDYDLPNEFRNGYLYINTGASSHRAYIIKQGLSSYPPVKQGVEEIDFAVGDGYVRSGKAIRFYWGSGTYFERNNIRTKKPGEECLNFTCLAAPFMTEEQINRILHSERRITQKN